jgi:hypothetical protein
MRKDLSFSLALLVILGCSKPGILEVSQSSLSFSWDTIVQRVDVSCTGEWRASSSVPWCHIVSTFNPHGISAAYVEIQCDANLDLTERSCVVSITSGDLSSQISVTQAGKQGFIIKSQSIDISSDEQDVKIPIEYNTRFYVRILDESKDWVSSSFETKAVETADIVFHVKRNTSGLTRTASIVFSDDYNFYDQYVSINQEAGKVNDDAANCYLVSSSGTHSFNALYKGRTYESIGAPKSAKVIWETFNEDTPITEGALISSCHLNEGSGDIEYTIRSDVKSGNAIIAAFSGEDGTGDILWSWHIWYIEGYDAEAYSEKYLSGRVFMDRNLGALSADDTPKANGLLYQWGRKDPFPGKAFSDNTVPISTSSDFDYVKSISPNDIEYSIQNPLTFIGNWNEAKNADLWGSDIGLYNPCPKGWTIPKGLKSWNKGKYADDGDWSGITTRNFDQFSGKISGIYYKENGNNISWYPTSGRRLSDSGDIEWFGNQSFFFWSQTIEYVMTGTYTNVFGTNSYSYYNITFGDYTQDGRAASANGFSIRCVKE